MQSYLQLQMCSGQAFSTSLHEEVTELLGSQPQDSQPLPLARFQWLGAQWSHVRPMTFGRHWHCPVVRWHTQSSRSIHWLRSVPRKLQMHSEGQRGKNVCHNDETWNNINVQSIFFSEHVTHSCSCAGKRPRSSRSCRCHSLVPRCCKDISCTLRFVCHTRPCLTCLCCCCTGTAGSVLRAERGFHNNPEHIPHTEHLKRNKKQNGERERELHWEKREKGRDVIPKYFCNENGWGALQDFPSCF